MKNDYDKVRTSRNELEAILRIRGISKQRFGRILNITGSTIEKYIENPYHLRYYQMQRLAQFLNIEVKDVIDIIEIDLKEDSIVVEGEDNFKAVESLIKQKNNDDI
jgi:predicted transcriptional regulator|tara:strand:- start:1004 stop:1321 length:318 start_codon:yes stop_codon:yes gene_type:complete